MLEISIKGICTLCGEGSFALTDGACPQCCNQPAINSIWRDHGLTVGVNDSHAITIRRHDDETVITVCGEADIVERLSSLICSALNSDDHERRRVGSVDPSTVRV